MGGYAWVTLATNNSYSLGALVLAHSLKKSNTAHKLVVLITSSVSESMRNQLNTVFDVVKLVDVLDSKDEAHLALMQRPELGITFTKIHCWRLIEFEKCVFLDADTLVVRNCDELFEREEFSAAPDASWPDCFNSGVFVFRPSIETFNKILQFAVENKSFDGGDQGLLNQFFSSWATEDIKKHLPFVYNLTSVGSYAYIPAFKHYGSETRIVHFIGTGKPWLQQLDIATKTVKPSTGYEHLGPLLQQWWDLFCEKVHPNLDKNLESNNEGMSHSPVEACSNSLPIALTDEPQTLRLIPCTKHEEKVVTEHNLSFNKNDSSGESPKPFVFVPETKQVRNEPSWRENVCWTHEKPQRVEERVKKCTAIQNRIEKEDKEEKKEQQPQEPQEEPPPKDPFDYESFFPDESCIKNYLEQNVVTYQPFENQEEVKTHKEPEPLPRFLTMPEDDRRQSGNVDSPVKKDEPQPQHQHQPQHQPTPEKETENITKEKTPPRETLTKSKSLPFLPLEATPEPPKPLTSIWKSQPNVNVDPNKKYSMPKLKPILPKQNSRYIHTKIPKVTHYTEFLMSSEYKDPVNLPKDRIGFVATQLHTQRHKRNKTYTRAKFGPLPFIPSPEKEKPACKKIRLEHSDDDLYDLTQCKRQSGNKPKPIHVQKKPNASNVEEILKRLKEFTKDYQHYFGVMPKPRKRTVMCKNAIVQASGEGECRTSEAFKIVRTAVCSWSRGTQTPCQRDEFRLFRNYVKNQNEASQKGLLMISGRRSKDGKVDSKLAAEEENVILGKNNDHIKNMGSTSLRHSGSVEKTVAHSKNQSGLIVKGKQQNPVDDVTLVERNSIKLQKSEGNKNSVRVESSTEQNEELVVNLGRLTVEESQNDGEVTTAQNNRVCTKQQKSESPVVQKESLKSQSGLFLKENPADDVTIGRNNDVSLSFQKSSKLKENVNVESTKAQSVHSENHPRLSAEGSRHNDDVTTAQNNGLSLTENRIESSKTSLNRKEELAVRSEEQSSLDVGKSQQDDDVTTAQNNDVSLSFQKNDINVESAKFESIHSENHLRLTVEESQQDDVTTAQSNGVLLTKNSIESPKTSRSRTEKELTVQSEDQSSLVVEKNQQDDDVITNQKVPLNLQKSPAQSQEFKNEKEQVLHSKNQSPLPVGEKQLCDDVTTAQKNGISLKIKKPEFSTDGGSVESSTVGGTNDVTNGFSKLEHESTKDSYSENESGRRHDVISKSEEVRTNVPTAESESSSHSDSNFESKETTTTPSGDLTTSFKTAQSTPFTSSPVAVPPQNGHDPQQNDEKVKKPEEMLCVPDFETPRSSRVTVKTTEEETTAVKSRKPRSSPKKVHGKYGKGSPDESFQFTGKPSGKEELLEEAKDTSGIAGAIAQLSLQAGSEQTPESTAASAAHQEYLRRQNWETGNIDYMGRDSFDNIWSKICQTLEAKDQEPPATGGEVKKPSDLPNVPEFIETLPGKPAPGPVEDDEIIFSKPDSRQSGLTNISEEEEVGGEGVKLSDILGKGKGDGKGPDGKPGVAEAKIEASVPSSDAKLAQSKATEIKPPVPAGTEGTPLPAAPETKSQPAVSDVKPQPTATEMKAQLQPAEVTPLPATTETKAQPAASEVKPQPVATEMKPQPPSTEGTPLPPAAETKPQPTATETKAQPAVPEVKPQPVPTETKPQSPSAEGKTQTAGMETKPEPTVTPTEIKAQIPTAPVEVKPVVPETKMEPPAPLPDVKPQPAAVETKPQPPPTEGTLPADKEGKAQPQPTAAEIKPTDMKIQLPAAPVETAPQQKTTDQKQPTAETPGECKVVAIPSPPILPPSTQPKIKQQQERPQVQSEPIPLPPPDSPSSEQPVKTSDSSKDDGKQKKGVFTKILEMVGVKEKNGSEETKSVFYDVEGGGESGAKEVGSKQPETAKQTEDTKPEVEVEKKEAEKVQPIPKPERSQKESIQVSETKRKSPSPKLTMPQTPDTAVTTPTPPASQEIPPMKNPALLKVEETILETPPVPEPSTIQTEIEDIIGKAKTEVETLLEKETTDAVNTMKLIMGEEQEEVEELKVTSEEERKKHKGEVVSSKLSDQILKAIPPPRRKAISEATASTSAIPKATPETKSPQPTAEGKPKSTKPSSIPVPPPRNKGKPQPPPSKGKGKK